ncbi:MAG TPA: DUF72 domain-containing protein [Steroidobacteraceae bacterium]|nr:DUF72 domain-containing protein [Steroidobacteraceae bacterium]
MILVGTAGWSIPKSCAQRFAADGTHLQRYARVLRCVEIDSSFYKDHSARTYAKWAKQTPRSFRFAVKLPREITHEQRLRAARRPLMQFLARVAGLGRRLGPLIVQLPPSLPFDAAVARRFFKLMREQSDAPVVCEPRHASWFEARAEAVLRALHIGRVAADPAIVPSAAQPGGWPGIVYYRLHGSPRRYWSVYEADRIAQWKETLQSLPRRTPVWCVFDNTAAGGATSNALQMLESLGHLPVRRHPV